MIAADTITTAQTVAIFHALQAATDRARLIMRRAQDASTTPAAASDALNKCIAKLQLALADAIDPAM